MHRALLVRVLAFIVAFGVLGSLSSPAEAQTVTVGASKGITRKVGFRSRIQRRFWVSKADCNNDDVITFPVTITGYAGYLFQVWAGAVDCTAPEQRASATAAQCWKVFQSSYSATGPGGSISIQIPARTLVAQVLPSDVKGADPVQAADESVCTKGGQQALALYFMLVDTTGTVIGKSAPWQASTTEQGMGYDLAGPIPPTSISLGVGENRLHANWTASTESDIVGYNLYCDPPAGALGTGTDAGTLGFLPGYRTLAADASVASGGVGGVGGSSGLGGAGGTLTGGAGGTLGAAGATASGGFVSTSDGGVIVAEGGVATPSSCAPTTALVPGSLPDAKYQCGYTPNVASKSGTAENLVNDVQYIVAVAAIDTVGNVGPLSQNSCETPVKITDFFELYRDLGGKGGCSFTPRRATHGGALAAAALVAALAFRRKARRRP